MNLSGLTQLLADLPAYRRFVEDVRAGQPDRAPLALYGAARAFVVAGLFQELGRPVLYVVARSEHARQVHDELQIWLPPAASGDASAALSMTAPYTRATVPLYYFADPDALPYERVAWSRETRQARLGALTALAQRSAAGLRSIQTGFVRNYALAILLGMIAILGYLSVVLNQALR